MRRSGLGQGSGKGSGQGLGMDLELGGHELRGMVGEIEQSARQRVPQEAIPVQRSAAYGHRSRRTVRVGKGLERAPTDNGEG